MSLLTATLYARVSSKEQEREGFSIDSQVRLLRKYASENGFEIAREFVEVETAARSGRANSRRCLLISETRRTTVVR